MLITLSHRNSICQSVAEVQLTGVVPLETVSHRLNFKFLLNLMMEYIIKNNNLKVPREKF